jgi:uncharacterized surface protein with fasciclin (FAS1) repeats
MKFISKSTIAAPLLSLFLIIASCDKSEETEPDFRENTILTAATSDPNLSLFVNALAATDLSQTLQASEPYTVFAPTNAAFEKYLTMANYYDPGTDPDPKKKPPVTINRVPVNLLKQLVLNHIVLGNVKSTDLKTGYVKTLATSSISKMNTMSMYIDVTSGVKLNGASTVTTPNIIVSNGTIHIVDAVIDFPMITTHLKLNPKLSTMLDVVNKNAGTTLLNRLALPNFYEKGKQQFFLTIAPVTIFAPTNTAFDALNVELAPGGIAGISASDLNKIVMYHCVSDNVLANSLTENQKIPSLIVLPTTPPDPVKYEEFTVQLAGGAKIKDVRNRLSTIESTDIQCWNGIIHVVDKVLLPNL